LSYTSTPAGINPEYIFEGKVAFHPGNAVISSSATIAYPKKNSEETNIIKI
jgi:hypothetical protein